MFRAKIFFAKLTSVSPDRQAQPAYQLEGTTMEQAATKTLDVDGDGFLLDRDLWSEELVPQLAASDGIELNDQIMHYISEARRMYEEDGVVPPLRKFAKAMDVTTNDLYGIFKKGPMKLICKWGGLPKPTGCV
jgi:tRNA 2-thiouridine synthesizing protein E